MKYMIIAILIMVHTSINTCVHSHTYLYSWYFNLSCI